MRPQTPFGKSVVHLTPRWILDALGPFDLDPCASDPRPWDCAAVNYTARDNGLLLPWSGRVWLNPPFARNEIGLWIGRMALHGRGTALVHARTDTAWFRHIWEDAELLLFLAGRVVFLTPEGKPQRTSAGTVSDSGAPVVLAAFGQDDADSLAFSGLDGQLVVLRMRLVSVAEAETWPTIVRRCLGAIKGPVPLATIYEALSSHPRARKNRHWKAKVRQVLQQGSGTRVAAGIWSAARSNPRPQQRRSRQTRPSETRGTK